MYTEYNVNLPSAMVMAITATNNPIQNTQNMIIDIIRKRFQNGVVENLHIHVALVLEWIGAILTLLF